ncbi:hypothetical protein GALMADRAFT_144275 [Galerina marginata CBS 339.88]|uniref:Uncharacterized protein n=1 Tax=Galerina marginata (strain CBS 339.88) TaxID=685588 RepID=A0A067SIK9_GALM3|nr:hypothetical protein GALMADRAFT_144275 [Galerina marginata CBS 339.88]
MSDAGADSRLPPVAFQQSWIDSSLNSTILFAVLMGVYSIVFFATLYLYTTRKGQHRWFIVAVITLQYLLSALEFGLQWYLTIWEFIRNGKSRELIFLSLTNFPAWVQIVINIIGAAVTVLADGLLVWRCFYAWNRSFRVVGALLFLFVSEIVLFFSSIITPLAKKLELSPKEAIAINDTLAAAYVVSASTSLLATVLIAYRIYHVYHQSTAIVTSGGKFWHIIEILVQSAAIYAVMMIIQAVSLFLPNLGTSTSVFALDNYAVALMIPIAGIAPCAMVARVHFSSHREPKVKSTVHHLTDLRFRGRESYSDTRIEADNVIGINPPETLSAQNESKLGHGEKVVNEV